VRCLSCNAAFFRNICPVQRGDSVHCLLELMPDARLTKLHPLSPLGALCHHRAGWKCFPPFLTVCVRAACPQTEISVPNMCAIISPLRDSRFAFLLDDSVLFAFDFMLSKIYNILTDLHGVYHVKPMSAAQPVT
jgi:hypothetical protein